MIARTAGDAEADRRARFESVVDSVYEPLQRYLRRRVAAESATELLDDVLLVLWRRLDEVPDEPLPWSYGIARRCVANHFRGERRSLRLVERVGRHARIDVDDFVGTPGHDVAIWEALDTLGDADRELVRLWAWEQLEPREIAVVLGTSPNAVSIRLSRARRRLRSALQRQDAVGAGHEPTGRRNEAAR